MSHKYDPSGGLNAFYVEEQCAERAMRDELDYIEQVTNAQEITKYEARMQFLKQHSGDPKELELAKSILGIQ